MSYNAPSLSSYNYNANAPSDDGTQIAANRVSWQMVRTKLTDPLRNWLDAINVEIARALTESSEFGVPVGTFEMQAYAGIVPFRVGLNGYLSKTDYARLYAVMGDFWGSYATPVEGSFVTPPYDRYPRMIGVVTTIGTILGSTNKSHTHAVVDPGHAHNLVPFWYSNTGNQSEGGTRASNPNAGQVTNAAVTGISISAEGDWEARPATISVQGTVKP